MQKKITEKPLRYNFVFMFTNEDFWDAILGNELWNYPQVHAYHRAFEGNRLLQFLFRIHWSYSVNEKVRVPFKRIWFRKMYNQIFDNDLPVCFVYMGGNSIRYDGGFTDYVRKQSENNRQVVYHGDLISKKLNYDYSFVRNKVDLAITYDKQEAEQYGIHYFRETTYSKLIPEPENVTFEYDVYFLAAVKDRLPKIMEAYHKLHDAGIRCKFILVGVSPNDQIDCDDIEYSKGITYKENLEYVIRSRCILELIQGGSSDITLRTREAIAYRRKLLTDCQLCDEDFFNPGQLQKFNDVSEIDIDFIKEEFSPDDYEPEMDMNPLRRLYDIQDALDEIDRQKELRNADK